MIESGASSTRETIPEPLKSRVNVSADFFTTILTVPGSAILKCLLITKLS